MGELHHIAGPLPPPDRLVPRNDIVMVIRALGRRSVEPFKAETAKQRVPYHRLIRALADARARRMG